MSIFISIASYMDIELPKTVDDLFAKADNPDDIHLGIVEQNQRGKFHKFNNKNIKTSEMLVQYAKGAGFAREKAMKHYDGEDYFMQIDSHMRFEQGWDTRMKEILAQAQEIAGTQKVILSQYPAPYFVGSDGNDFYIDGDEHYWSEPHWVEAINTAQGLWAGRRERMTDFSAPHKSHTVLAGYIFTLGSIVEEVPYDPRITFMGEELCFALRAYTRGWEIYAPHEMLIYHFYTRKEHRKIWNTGALKRKWYEFEKESYAVQKNVLLGREEGSFGIGDYQRYLDYQAMIGVDFHEFYGENMQNIKHNLSQVETEIILDFDMDFMSKSMSRYCIINDHNGCIHIGDCECDCHKEA